MPFSQAPFCVTDFSRLGFSHGAIKTIRDRHLHQLVVVEVLGQQLSDDAPPPVRVLVKKFGLAGLLLKLGLFALQRHLWAKNE